MLHRIFFFFNILRKNNAFLGGVEEVQRFFGHQSFLAVEVSYPVALIIDFIVCLTDIKLPLLSLFHILEPEYGLSNDISTA